ncbi:MAG: cyclic nucleotide-binding domain-containing protein [Desulfobacteraceae bacterium]|nr:MAG: cyclic nucleotide-binding domain-containing protein [Desulfobacteraceae bacterium]
MYTGVALRLVWIAGVVMFAVFGSSATDSFAADKARDSALSDALVQVKLFAGLTDAERDALKSAATLRRGRAGERIIEQGKTLDRMFIVLEGRAEVRVNGKHIVTLSGQPLVGELEFLDGLPGSADLILLEETDLVELNNASLANLMEKQPRLGYVLMSEIARIEARRLRDTNPK